MDVSIPLKSGQVVIKMRVANGSLVMKVSIPLKSGQVVIKKAPCNGKIVSQSP